MESEYRLVIKSVSKPWWGFGFIVHTKEWKLLSPPGISYEQVRATAENLRRSGATVRIEEL